MNKINETNTIISKKEAADAESRASRRLPGLILTIALILTSGAFLFLLMRLKLLPALLFAALAGVVVLLILLVFVLSRDSARRGRFAAAVILTLLLAAVSAAGIYVSARFTDTIRNIVRRRTTETVVMEIYVRPEDPAVSLDALKDETFGILSLIDRSATDEMLRQLTEQLGRVPETLEYNSPAQLLNALNEGLIRAVIMNAHYLTLFEESGLASSVRVLHSRPVTVEITTEAPPETEKARPTKKDEPAGPGETEPAYQEPVYSDETVLKAENGRFIAYISGIDSRNGLVTRSRSDVNILAAVDPEARQIVLVSTPRDCRVFTPVSGSLPDTLTYTGNYGIDVSLKTMEMLYNLEIDYWFRVDFSGFIRIIDALGGIDVESDASFSAGGYSFRKGINHLSGAAALTFTRERHAFTNADLARGPHQMAVIRAVLKKAASREILTNWNELLSAVSDSFEMTLPYDVMASAVRSQLTSGGGWNIVSYSLAGHHEIKDIFSLPAPNYMFFPEEDSLRTARQLIWDLLEGKTVRTPE